MYLFLVYFTSVSVDLVFPFDICFYFLFFVEFNKITENTNNKRMKENHIFIKFVSLSHWMDQMLGQSGNGLGLKVVGGQEIPGSNMIGAYIQKIHPSLTMMGEIREGIP